MQGLDCWLMLERWVGLVTGMRIAVPARSAGTFVLVYGATIRDEGHREHVSGQAETYVEL
jgi:hypothetical protein